MEFIQILPFVIFGGIVILVYAVASLFASNTSRASERLDELRDPSLRNKEAKDERKGVGAMFEKAAPALSKALQPKTELEENKLKVRMANAGYIAPSAPQLFLAIKVAMMIVGAMFGGGFGLSSYGLTQNGLTALVLAGGFGFYLPEIEQLSILVF